MYSTDSVSRSIHYYRLASNFLGKVSIFIRILINNFIEGVKRQNGDDTQQVLRERSFIM